MTESDFERHTLAKWRALRGWSQQYLANAAGVSIGAVTDIEQNAVIPNLRNMRKLCDALGAPDGAPLLLDQVAWPTEITPRPAVSKRTQQRRLKKRQRQRAPESDEGSSSGEGGAGEAGNDGEPSGHDPKSEALEAA